MKSFESRVGREFFICVAFSHDERHCIIIMKLRERKNNFVIIV